MKSDLSSDRETSPAEDRLRALLRLKRLERPPEQFWAGFERDLQRELFRTARRDWTKRGTWILAPVLALALTLVMTSYWKQSDAPAESAERLARPMVSATELESGRGWSEEEWSGTRFVVNVWLPQVEEGIHAVRNDWGRDRQTQSPATEEVLYVADRWSTGESRSEALLLHP